VTDAYRVQDQMTALRLADGERRAGWKLGYTSTVVWTGYRFTLG